MCVCDIIESVFQRDPSSFVVEKGPEESKSWQ